MEAFESLLQVYYITTNLAQIITYLTHLAPLSPSDSLSDQLLLSPKLQPSSTESLKSVEF